VGYRVWGFGLHSQARLLEYRFDFNGILLLVVLLSVLKIVDLIDLFSRGPKTRIYTLVLYTSSSCRVSYHRDFGRVPSARILTSARTLPSARIGLTEAEADFLSIHATSSTYSV